MIEKIKDEDLTIVLNKLYGQGIGKMAVAVSNMIKDKQNEIIDEINEIRTTLDEYGIQL